MKKTSLFKCFVAMGVLLGTTAAVNAQATSGSCGDNATWSYNTSTKVLTISGTGEMADYRILGSAPWTSYWTQITSVSISGVTTIGPYAFSHCTVLTSVSIPNSVTSIGLGAFNNCIGLTSVSIPNSVTSIGNNAFDNCSKLTNVNIPNSITSIGDNAFRYCIGIKKLTIADGTTALSSGPLAVAPDTLYLGRTISITVITTSTSVFGTALKQVTIGNSVTSIYHHAFYGCTYLTSVSIPNSVTSIGNSTFYGCTGLTSISIPNSVTSIGSSAFENCSGLTSISIGNSVTTISSKAFYGCTGLTSVTIPYSVTTINGYAFSGCTGLTSISIPNSVTTIYGLAFDNCSNLDTVKVAWANPASVTLGTNLFGNIPSPALNTRTLIIPAGTASLYASVTPWSLFKQPFVEYSAPLVNAATPTITAEPQSSSTVNVGGSVSLSVTANAGDGGTLTYQWYSNTANNTSGSIVSGATSATYTPPTTTAGTLYYYVVVTNTNNSVNGTKTATTTSSVAEVTVNAIVNAVTPTITAHPQGSSTVNVGGSVSLSVTANAGDGGTLTYQWYSNTANNTSGSIVSGATSATYSAPTATAGTLYYYVVVTNTNNGVNGTKTATQTSSVATVTVNVVVVPPPPSNDANLQDLTVSKSTLSPAFDADSTHYTLLLPCDDSTVTINAVAPLGGGTVSYTVDGQAATKDVVARNIGTTAVRVRSTAAAGTTHKDYTVDVIRPFPKSIIVQYWNDILAVDQSQTKFTHFQWKDAGGEPVGKDRPYLSLVTDNVPPTGTYNVEVTTSNGQKTPVCVGVQTKPWAVTSSLTVYPNPVSGTMTVKNPDYESVHIIELFDLNGQLVGQYSSSEATSNIDVSGLSSGLYVLRAGRQTQKIIIE